MSTPSGMNTSFVSRLGPLALLALLGAGVGGAAPPKAPVPSRLCINELVASSDASWASEDGTFPDWIELHNASASPINLGDFILTDDPDASDLVPLDPSLVLEAGGFLVFAADGQPELGPTHLPFSLSAEGESIALLHVGGDGEVVSFGAVQVDFAWARSTDCCVDGADCFRQVWMGSPGAPNGAP
jgi:hypothetical protein